MSVVIIYSSVYTTTSANTLRIDFQLFKFDFLLLMGFVRFFALITFCSYIFLLFCCFALFGVLATQPHSHPSHVLLSIVLSTYCLATNGMERENRT